MKLTIYQIDAFTDTVFKGNPAAVVPLEQWLDESLMQAIAAENNLAETVFFVPEAQGFHIRWFTPLREVNLCGHATLAAAYVLFNELNYHGPVAASVGFSSMSGPLTVTRQGQQLRLDFPSQAPRPCELPQALVQGLGLSDWPLERLPECLAGDDYLVVFEHQQQVEDIQPDQLALARADLRGVIVTAPAVQSAQVDFVSRFFSPKYGIPEDPVTGSAHTQLTPYWAQRLGRKQLKARQISKRGGDLYCEWGGDRVWIAGAAVKYLKGEIEV
jgi:PhzF family phenazine biosynthesis protein